MKPVLIHLTAFGSYPGTETVDFAALSAYGLFVVSGATGSGKSTIFDAMTFALYGTVPGDRVDHVRSHHAPADAVTGVDLTFDTSEGRFCVRRTARFERLKQRGPGTTTVQPSANLYCVVDDGSPHGRHDPLASRTQEVNARCVELVGLTAQQFQRVVLLPQGKCAEFLMADTAPRRALLQQLFGTQLFERATDLARVRAGELRTDVDARNREVERHCRNAATDIAELRTQLRSDDHADHADHTGHTGHGDCPDHGEPSIVDIAKAVDELTPLVHQRRTVTDAATADADRLRTRRDAAATAAKHWDTRASLTGSLAVLDAERASIDADDARRAAAERAAPVVKTAAALGLALSRQREIADAAEGRRRQLVAEAHAAGIELGDRVAMDTALADVSAKLGTRRVEVTARLADAARLAAADASMLTLRHAAAEAADSLALAETEAADLGQQLHAITERLAARAAVASTIGDRTAAARAAGEIVALRHEVSELESHAQLSKVAADDADATLDGLTVAFLASVAPHLAESLVAGNPCPVCGSADHPAPAHHRVSHLVTREQLDSAKGHRDQLSRSLHDVLGRLDDRRRQLGPHLATDIVELERKHQAALAHLGQAREAETDVLAIGADRARIDKLAARCNDRLPARRSANLSAQTELGVASARAAALRQQLGRFDTARLADELDVIARAGKSIAALDTLDRQRAGADGAAALAADQLAAALDERGFGDVEEARSVELPEGQIGVITERVERWHRDHLDLRTRLAALVDHADLPEQRPDVDAIAAQLTSATDVAARAARRQHTLDVRLSDAAAAIGAARAVDGAAAAARAACQTAATVFAVCNGDNAPRVQLETWVLAGELDRVTDAANVHLARMTGHRYSLHRDEPSGAGNRRSGLDLMVADSDTGRRRPPSTLSGGEQFQASLALALGLADVVSQGGPGSGKVYEAMFIDEGFGSLDADALDRAVDALLDLRSTGRMVGVITHVDALKRQLPIGIDVVKHSAGGSAIHQPMV